jgi:hypothetical protein
VEETGERFKRSNFVNDEAIANLVKPNSGGFSVEKTIVAATGVKTAAGH